MNMSGVCSWLALPQLPLEAIATLQTAAYGLAWAWQS